MTLVAILAYIAGACTAFAVVLILGHVWKDKFVRKPENTLTPWQEGYLARVNGQSQCPYHPELEYTSRAWFDGWKHADMVYTDKCSIN